MGRFSCETRDELIIGPDGKRRMRGPGETPRPDRVKELLINLGWPAAEVSGVLEKGKKPETFTKGEKWGIGKVLGFIEEAQKGHGIVSSPERQRQVTIGDLDTIEVYKIGERVLEEAKRRSPESFSELGDDFQKMISDIRETLEAVEKGEEVSQKSRSRLLEFTNALWGLARYEQLQEMMSEAGDHIP